MIKKISPEDTDLLLVVDPQNDFCPGGALAVSEGDEIVPIINSLAETFNHVVLTQDWHPDRHFSFASSHSGKEPYDVIEADYGEQVLWPDHCVQGTVGAEFHKGLELNKAEMIVRKGFHEKIDSYSAFFENDRKTTTGLGGYLKERGFTRIFIAGLATDFCVMYTALDGVKLGFKVLVIEDGCRGIDIDGSLSTAWVAMKEAGAQNIMSSVFPGH